MTVETEVDFARALERLRRRDTESLAAFILSLAQDSGAGLGAGADVHCGGCAELIGRAATSVPRADVVAALVPLMDDDGYGVRGVLADVIASRKVIP